MAHRTSPTNLGLLLLCTTSARDLGYLGYLEFIERQELTLAAMAKLGKFKGHFFNWYDTKTLQPLIPQYISTVDSGNLAGHLIACRQALIELPETPLFNQQTVDGLLDTLNAISFEAKRLRKFRQRTDVVNVSDLRNEIDASSQLLMDPQKQDLNSWAVFFISLSRHAADIEDIVNALSHEHGANNFEELTWWAGAFKHQIDSYQRDIKFITSWASVLPQISSITREASEQSEVWKELLSQLSAVPCLADIPKIADRTLVQLAALQDSDRNRGVQITVLTEALEKSAEQANALLSRFSSLANNCDVIADEMDFSFLFDPERKLFTIGYNVSELRADDSFYDLLASEARLASFVAIAKGEVPQEHWFRMGRMLAQVDGGRALISWTGTMFEYLMPLLVMKNFKVTLLDETYNSVVRRQIEYGGERNVPWGISEAAYNVRDLNMNYQYGPFGVPGLGLKRGLIEDLVVAPYASILAAQVQPPTALENLRRVQGEGAFGKYGFYESIDYTPARLPQGQTNVIIRAFMAHHQGMSLVALGNIIQEDLMARRFHSDPQVQATELLLQERVPVGVRAIHPRAEEVLTGRVVEAPPGSITRTYETAELDTPRTQLLSNGNYSVMLTTAGSGYSNCGPNAVVRWREDVTRDNWGTFIYLRDVRSGTVWSATRQPTRKRPQSYKVAFSEDKAEFWRNDAGIETHMEVVVSAEDNAEVRRISLTNTSMRSREIEVTSYAEVVLAPSQADAAHPAFSNLFIQTEFFAAENALLAHRRRRSSDEPEIWGVHVMVAEGDLVRHSIRN